MFAALLFGQGILPDLTQIGYNLHGEQVDAIVTPGDFIHALAVA